MDNASSSAAAYRRHVSSRGNDQSHNSGNSEAGRRKGTFEDVVPIVSDQDGQDDIFEIGKMSEDNDSGFLEFEHHDGDEADDGGQAGGNGENQANLA